MAFPFVSGRATRADQARGGASFNMAYDEQPAER
jgi:hypothetical protein